MSDPNAIAALTRQVLIQMRLTGFILHYLSDGGTLTRSQCAKLIDEVAQFGAAGADPLSQEFDQLWQKLYQEFL